MNKVQIAVIVSFCCLYSEIGYAQDSTDMEDRTITIENLYYPKGSPDVPIPRDVLIDSRKEGALFGVVYGADIKDADIVIGGKSKQCVVDDDGVIVCTVPHDWDKMSFYFILPQERGKKGDNQEKIKRLLRCPRAKDEINIATPPLSKRGGNLFVPRGCSLSEPAIFVLSLLILDTDKLIKEIDQFINQPKERILDRNKYIQIQNQSNRLIENIKYELSEAEKKYSEIEGIRDLALERLKYVEFIPEDKRPPEWKTKSELQRISDTAELDLKQRDKIKEQALKKLEKLEERSKQLWTKYTNEAAVVSSP